jgi:hypothetical protein
MIAMQTSAFHMGATWMDKCMDYDPVLSPLFPDFLLRVLDILDL